MSFDERACLARRRARQFGQRCQILGECLRKSRAELEFTDDDVAGAHALLPEECDELRVGLSQVVHPGIRVNEYHDFFHAERLGARARGALPPSFASRSLASRARSARSPSSTSAVFVTPG